MTPPPTETELRAFVGRRADYYLSAWAPRLEGKSDFRFNLAGFFLSVFWMSYRRLYRPVAILFASCSSSRSWKTCCSC